MSLIKSTQTVGITITGSLTHLHVNFDISIITWNVFMTVFTVKDVEVVHPSFLGARKMSTCYSTAPAGGKSSAQTALTFLRD